MEEGKKGRALIDGDANVVRELNNITTNNNITYVGKAGEEAIQSERKAEYRQKCEKLIDSGVISRQTRLELDTLADILELDVATRKEIEGSVRKRSARQAAGKLGYLEEVILNDAIEMIRNNSSDIRASLHKLEAFGEADVDEVQFYYHLLLVCENPTEYIRKYENRDSDNYWKTFWAYVAYKKNGTSSNAERLLRDLTQYTSYPAGNVMLLDCAGWLFPTVNGITEDYVKMAIKAFNRSCGVSISGLLSPFMEALENIISYGTGTRKLTGKNETDFYLGRIFGVIPVQHIHHLKDEQLKTYSSSAAGTVISDEAIGTIDSAATKNISQDAVRVAVASRTTSAPIQTSSLRTVPVQEVPPSSSRKPSFVMPIISTVLLLGGLLGGYFGVKALFFNDTEKAAVITKVQKSGTASDIETSSGTKPAIAATKPSSASQNTKAVASSKTQSTSGQHTLKPAVRPAPKSEGQVKVEPHALQQKSAAEMSAAEAYSVGRNYKTSGNYSKAAEYLKSAADRGDIASSYEIALLYQNGSGVGKNLTLAFSYMKKAADAGYVKAFRPLGEMYHGGRGVQKDRSVAEYWYKKAADNGDATARRILNNM